MKIEGINCKVVPEKNRITKFGVILTDQIRIMFIKVNYFISSYLVSLSIQSVLFGLFL